MRISIKEITGSRQFCPFNIDAFHYLSNSSQGIKVLDELHELYKKISYSFSSPGNSFQRNVIYELNRPYNYGKLVEFSLFNNIKDNKHLLSDYNKTLNELNNLLNGIKFRQIDPLVLRKMAAATDITITSDWLTNEGIFKTLNTFENIPNELRTKMRFESVDFWTQFEKSAASH